jgi:hypothetical protein
MYKYKINTTQISGATNLTINIPIKLEYQLVDNAELIEKVFVDTEIKKSINPILDYEKVRFVPFYNLLKKIDTITYIVSLLDDNNRLKLPTYYADIGINDSDIKFGKNYFKEGYLLLSFYDNDNPLTQNLVTEIEIYNHLSIGDYLNSGQARPANQIMTKFVLSNPLTTSKGFFEGYHIYTYKDNYQLNGVYKSLYMKASYFNAKTGKMINLMTSPLSFTINELISKLHTKFDLVKDSTGYYYKLDTGYSTNVAYSETANSNLMDLTINLYQIQTK